MRLTTIGVLAAATMAAPAVAAGRGRDSDRDGLSDRYEVRKSGTRPRTADTDRDGLTDGFEVRSSRTNPRRRDTDRESLSDGFEVRKSRTSPRRRDTDGDGLSDSYELRRSRTSPLRADTDGDSVSDGMEVLLGMDPLTKPTGPSFPQGPAPGAESPPGPPLPDLVPPETRITAGPSGTVASGSASFSFTSSEAGSAFQCRLDSGAWAACSSPRSYAGLANGSHSFDVRATDPAANTDATPASRTWTVDLAPSSGRCDRSATTSSFASQVSAATAGQTICLASGGYGSWSGTNKAITIRPEDGASPTMAISFGSGDCCFTIDGGRTSFSSGTGLTITGGGSPAIGSGANNITIKNTNFTAGIRLDGLTNSNILFDHNQHFGLSANDYTAAIHLSYGASQPSGVTIQNSLFRDMSADGVQAGPAVNILNNEFARIRPAVPEQHTDAIQLYDGCASALGVGSTIRGNYIHEGEQAIGAFDGACGNLIEHNVVQNFTAHWITVMGDRPGSTVQWNTITGSGAGVIACGSKAGYPSSQTIIRNNVAGGIDLSNGVACTPTQSTNNMLRSGGSGGNFSGAPTFAGGSSPSTFGGFQLAAGSPGKGRAADGSDVGAFGAGFAGGPPSQ